MLRFLALALLIANAAYFAWAQGVLLAWGLGPAQQREPQRMAQQIAPESIRVLRNDDPRRGDGVAAAPRPPECLQAGPLEETHLAAVRPLLEAWPAGSWSLEPAVEPARWIVYMGKYPTAEQAEKKRAELRQLSIVFEPLSNTALEPGLSLGGFANEADARKQLEVLGERGVRSARVVQERPEVRGQRLSLPAVDDNLRGRLEELRIALNVNGKPLRACR